MKALESERGGVKTAVLIIISKIDEKISTSFPLVYKV